MGTAVMVGSVSADHTQDKEQRVHPPYEQGGTLSGCQLSADLGTNFADCDPQRCRTNDFSLFPFRLLFRICRPFSLAVLSYFVPGWFRQISPHFAAPSMIPEKSFYFLDHCFHI